MASAVTDASASTSTSIGSSIKRTLSSAIQDSAGEGPAPKKLKKETKLDRLKAQQKVEAALLKKNIEHELEFVKDKDVANEPMLSFYCHRCDWILAGETLDEHALTLFKTPFANYFVGEDALREKLGPRMLLRRTQSASLMSSLQ